MLDIEKAQSILNNFGQNFSNLFFRRFSEDWYTAEEERFIRGVLENGVTAEALNSYTIISNNIGIKRFGAEVNISEVDIFARNLAVVYDINLDKPPKFNQ